MPPSDQLDQYQPCRLLRLRSTTISGSSLLIGVGDDNAVENRANKGPTVVNNDEINMLTRRVSAVCVSTGILI